LCGADEHRQHDHVQDYGAAMAAANPALRRVHHDLVPSERETDPYPWLPSPERLLGQ
jgi:hypothetical protein